VRVCVRACVRARVRVRVRACVRMRVCLCAYVRACERACVCACVRARVRVHARVLVCVFACARTQLGAGGRQQGLLMQHQLMAVASSNHQCLPFGIVEVLTFPSPMCSQGYHAWVKAQRAPVTFYCLVVSLVHILAVLLHLFLAGQLTELGKCTPFLINLPFEAAALVMHMHPLLSEVGGQRVCSCGSMCTHCAPGMEL